MQLDLFSLEGNAVSSSAFYGVYGFGMTLDSLSLNVQGCVPFCWRISMRCLALEFAGSWPQCRYGGFWVDSHLLMFPGVRSFVVLQSSVVEPLASGF